jgi:hypothetical protein
LHQHFIMMPVRHPFSAFEPENTPLLQENQYNYIRFDFLNPPYHYPLRAIGPASRRPELMIPIFQNSNIPIGAKPLTCFRHLKISINSQSGLSGIGVS